ncbi:MAG: NUDIX hydrolase [bacterium]|nr:NUDIX hydrolase [bacterium]
MDTSNTIQLQVGVKAFIRRADGKFLLLKRAEAFEGETEPRWDIPGGRIEPGEPIRQALEREIKEETGLTLDSVQAVLEAQDILRVSGRHVVRITFLATIKDGEMKLDPVEHSDARWVTLAELNQLHHDMYLDPVISHPLLVK